MAATKGVRSQNKKLAGTVSGQVLLTVWSAESAILPIPGCKARGASPTSAQENKKLPDSNTEQRTEEGTEHGTAHLPKMPGRNGRGIQTRFHDGRCDTGTMGARRSEKDSLVQVASGYTSAPPSQNLLLHPVRLSGILRGQVTNSAAVGCRFEMWDSRPRLSVQGMTGGGACPTLLHPGDDRRGRLFHIIVPRG